VGRPRPPASGARRGGRSGGRDTRSRPRALERPRPPSIARRERHCLSDSGPSGGVRAGRSAPRRIPSPRIDRFGAARGNRRPCVRRRRETARPNPGRRDRAEGPALPGRGLDARRPD
jgi:hypothetical protein